MKPDEERSKSSDPEIHYARTVPSRLAISRHPLHPILVVYPVAFLSMLVVTDIVYLLSDEAFWAQVSFWLNLVGFGLGLFAALFGIGDLLLLRAVRRHVVAWSHFIAAVALLALAATGVWLRWPDPVAAIWPWGLLQASMTCLLVVVAGWLGGTLSFRHGVGVYGGDERLGTTADSPDR